MREIIHHLETRVQHEFLVMSESGKVLRRVTDEITAITPEDWPKYSSVTFPKMLAESQAQLDKQNVPNRATRRAKAKK